MSRSGYVDDDDGEGWMNLYRGNVNRCIGGKRGQAFLREMLAALDSMPCKRLIRGELIESDGACCALGRVAQVRALDVSGVDPDDREQVGGLFNIPPMLAAEIVFHNDEHFYHASEEDRWSRMREWVESHIKK